MNEQHYAENMLFSFFCFYLSNCVSVCVCAYIMFAISFLLKF